MGSASSVQDKESKTELSEARIKTKVKTIGVLQTGGVFSRAFRNPPKMSRQEMKIYITQKREEKEEDWSEIQQKYLTGQLESSIRYVRQQRPAIAKYQYLVSHC